MNLISQLLIQDSFPESPIILPESFGDAYLVMHNRTYRKIREKCVNLDYQYRWEGRTVERYRAAPLLALDELISSKTIPYHRNKIPLRSLLIEEKTCAAWLNRPESIERLLAFLEPNRVLHESAHAVANETCAGLPMTRERLIFEEALANTTELWCALQTRSEKERFFLKYQSPYTCTQSDRDAIDSENPSHFIELVFSFLDKLRDEKRNRRTATGLTPVIQNLLSGFNPEFIRTTMSSYFSLKHRSFEAQEGLITDDRSSDDAELKDCAVRFYEVLRI